MLNLLLAQLNLACGDLAGNARLLMQAYRQGETIGADLVIGPELSLMGYPIRDVITRYPFLVEENMAWLHAMARHTQKTRLVVGFVEKCGGNAGKPYYNALGILGEGRIEGIVRKSLLPVYAEFNDSRTYEPSPLAGCFAAETLGQPDWEAGLSTQNGQPYTLACHDGTTVKIGFSICEDLWADPTFFQQSNHKLGGQPDPVATLMRHQPDLLINCSASPSRSRKEGLRQALLGHIAKRWQVPLVYVNQVGAIDECSYDGLSRVLDATGQVLAQAPAFESALLPVQVSFKAGAGTPPLQPEACHRPQPLPENLSPYISKRFNPTDPTELERVYKTLCQGIRDYFAKTGFQRAVLGLSGGLDSSVCAVLLADALGGHNVLGVSMPSRLTPDDSRSDARLLAHNLGLQWAEAPIVTMVDGFMSTLDNLDLSSPGSAAFAQKEDSEKMQQDRWAKSDSPSFAADNVQAMSRATLLRLLGNHYRALPVATSDKSELYLGYTTVNGDMSGALAPLADIPKTQVRALAHWLNQHREIPNALPLAVIEKPSGADLALDPATGKLLTAEAALMPYLFADEVIWRLEALHQSYPDLLAASYVYQQTHPLTDAQKKAWLDKFFSRMSSAVFKWWIAPPMILVSGYGSIAKTDYHHPITSNRICWQGHTPEEKEGILQAHLKP